MALCADNYATRVAELLAELDRIRRELETHRRRAAAIPGNWGMVGDLATAVDTLREVRL